MKFDVDHEFPKDAEINFLGFPFSTIFQIHFYGNPPENETVTGDNSELVTGTSSKRVSDVGQVRVENVRQQCRFAHSHFSASNRGLLIDGNSI